MTREYMVTPIPALPDDMREAAGIAQTDIILRTAIMAGLDDLRANPKLLDYVFASLPKDALTYKQYGEEQVALAKQWFLSQDIPVSMNTRLDATKLPVISIAQVSSVESAVQLGDVHYKTSESYIDETPIIYGGPFNALKYDPATGIVTMSSSFSLEVFPGMLVRDNAGQTHPILDVVDSNHFTLQANLNADLRDFFVVSQPAAQSVSLEGREFRETFEIGVHAHSEPVYLTYLHSIVVFILLRYYEELIEARGLTRLTISSGPVSLNQSFEINQPVFTRMINVTGFVYQYWPKFIAGPVVGMDTTVTSLPNIGFEKVVVPAAYPDIVGDDS